MSIEFKILTFLVGAVIGWALLRVNEWLAEKALGRDLERLGLPRPPSWMPPDDTVSNRAALLLLRERVRK